MIYIYDGFTSLLLKDLKIYYIWVEVVKKVNYRLLDITEYGFRNGLYVCIAYAMAKRRNCFHFY